MAVELIHTSVHNDWLCALGRAAGRVWSEDVRHWVDLRDRGLPVTDAGRRPRLIDPFVDKVEEWVDRSKGPVRTDGAHERLLAVGFRRGRAHHPPRGRGSKSPVRGRASAHLSAVGVLTELLEVSLLLRVR